MQPEQRTQELNNQHQPGNEFSGPHAIAVSPYPTPTSTSRNRYRKPGRPGLGAQMVVDPDMTSKEALAEEIKDLLSIFPQLTRENIISISCFHKDWAACPTQQQMRQSGPNRYPIKVDPFENLFMVSHDSQGWGFSGDLIGHAAWTFNQMI